MEEIVKEVKRRFPIGCRYKTTVRDIFILEKDDNTYFSFTDYVHAHRGGGCLYENGKYAELVDENDNVIKINMEPNYEIY